MTHLYNQDATSAWHTYQDAMNVEEFSNSDEAFAADALFAEYRLVTLVLFSLYAVTDSTACRGGTVDTVRKYVKEKQVFRHLDNQVSRLALKLPTGQFDKMSALVQQAMGGGRDEEEEQEDDVM